MFCSQPLAPGPQSARPPTGNATLCATAPTAATRRTVVSLDMSAEIRFKVKLMFLHHGARRTPAEPSQNFTTISFPASQGYSGRGFACDFEAAGMCGWTDQSLNAPLYGWQRRQGGGATLPRSGPSSDFSTGTATGVDPSSSLI